MKFRISFGATFLAYFALPVLSSINETPVICPVKNVSEYKYPYVVYGKQPECHVASRQGPCTEGSVLFAKPRSHFGVCSCECFLDEGIEFDDSTVKEYRYCFNARVGHVFAYDKKRCACYQLGSQGPCPKGQIFQKPINEANPKCCAREDSSSQPHTPIEEEKCPPGTIYSTLLNMCTDMNFHGLNQTNGSNETNSNGSSTGGKCPPGTIYSTLLNQCVGMDFHGLSTTTARPTNGKCPPGTIISELLNMCVGMDFHGLSTTPGWGQPEMPDRPSSRKCPPGTIYSTLLNICTDMNFKGLGWGNRPNPGSGTGRRCPAGTIYSTLLNRCTDMNFHGLPVEFSNSIS